MTSLARRRRFTVEDVRRMVEAGVLHEGDRVELLDGELVEMTPQGPLHRVIKDLLAARLQDAYKGRAYVSDQAPVDLNAYSQPEPDLAVYRGEARDYLSRHPRGDEALLVVEVAYSSQEIDREKAALYAQGGVPVYWILDLVARRIEVHDAPHAGRYGRITILDETGTVTPPGLDVRWEIATLLP